MVAVKTRAPKKKQTRPNALATGVVMPITHDLAPSEWPIMNILWEKSPCPAGQVQEDLKSTKNWAYSTVKTTMDRMAKKGILRTESLKNVTMYFPNITREEAQTAAIAHAREFAFNSSGLEMMQFMLEHNEFPAADMEQLRRLFIQAFSTAK